ncbi:MAG: ammonia-forming cytochrome c nitrite reductase subunit c552 [Gammaproteobacteria bacterium]|nr:ammonia-forming cytochrome c nitrite reductase subunit c552 [Gammaproteobacteria bacterium]
MLREGLCRNTTRMMRATAIAAVILGDLAAAATSSHDATDGFVGSATCATCHRKEARAWEGSHHDRALMEATSASVRGDFDERRFGETRFYKDGADYFIETPGPDGEFDSYLIAYTIGWEPLQQYLVDVGQGKLQALDIAWDTSEKKWFRLGEGASPGDWLHWTGGAMNWNTMCADCHSTNLVVGYDAETDTFDTRWSAIDVGCEACHGPGRAHTTFMASPASAEASVTRIRQDLAVTAGTDPDTRLGQCAACHSLREKLVAGNSHDGDFFAHYSPNFAQPPAYFADGQIREEVYVYGSFLQSRMHSEEVSCSDCHEPHSLEVKASIDDNSLCLQCHDARYSGPDHAFHPGSAAVGCVDCHMPGRTYMGNDFRRDHSFRPPRPDLTISAGVPNACNGCHEDRSAEWARASVAGRYGADGVDQAAAVLVKPNDTDSLAGLALDASRPVMARATAARLLAQPGGSPIDILEDLAADPSPLVRKAVATALGTLPHAGSRQILLHMLRDSTRAVRIAAVEPLIDIRARDLPAEHRSTFKAAINEYETYLDINRYFPTGLMNIGNYHHRRERPEQAEQAWRKALEKDTSFSPARLNLATLLNSQGRNQEAKEMLQQGIARSPENGSLHYSLALLLAEMDELPRAVSELRKAAKFSPDVARIHYNLAVALQQSRKLAAAEEAYLDAIRLASENITFRYGIATLYLQQGDHESARPHVELLAKREPNNPAVRELRASICDSAHAQRTPPLAPLEKDDELCNH